MSLSLPMIVPLESAAGPVLLFDGECGLCQRLVRLLLRLDDRGVLRFAPLQGAPAREFLRAHGLPVDDFETLVFVPDWARRFEINSAFRLRTAGVIAALRASSGAGRVLGDLLALVPGVVRDVGYRLVARMRHRIFGPWRVGLLPRSEWAARFFA